MDTSLASCRGLDPDLFFPELGEQGHEAKAVCRGCVIREECLRHALERRERFGIWGGLSRDQLRRERLC